MKKVLISLFLIFISLGAVGQIVEQSRNASSTTEWRSGEARGAGMQTQSSVGLFFAKLALLEIGGPAAFGLDADKAKELAEEHFNTSQGVAPPGLGAMQIVHEKCENFKRRSLTYSHHPGFWKERAGRIDGIISFTEVHDQIEMQFGDEMYALPVARKNLGDPVRSIYRFNCLIIETGAIEQALTRLKRTNRGYVVPSDNELNYALVYGFETWNKSPSAQMLLSSKPSRDSACIVPTPTGYGKGFRNVSCGPFEYQMDSRAFLFGGTIMLDQNYVGGRRVVFDEFSRSESNVGRSKSNTNQTRKGVKIME